MNCFIKTILVNLKFQIEAGQVIHYNRVKIGYLNVDQTKLLVDI